MATEQIQQQQLVSRSYEMISFTGTCNIRSRQGQRIDLIARRGDILEVIFPTPSGRHMVRFSMNSKYVTIYWAENTGSMILYVNDKNSPSGYPEVNFRTSSSGTWLPFSDDENMHTDLARLIETQSFGVNRLIALYWNRYNNHFDHKPFRKAICHTKWQNVASLELRRRCQHMMADAVMTFDHYFKNLPAAGAGPSTAPRTAAARAGAANTAIAKAPVSATTAKASTGATISATGNALGATNAPTGTKTVATSTVPVGKNTMVTTNAPTTGANTVAAAQSSATNSAGPSTSSATMQDPPPMEPKCPVTWYPVTLAHLIKIESWGNSTSSPITPKVPGTIRPPAVFHFDDSDPFASTPSGSKVDSVAGASSMAPQTVSPAATIKGTATQGQARGRIPAPPPLPPLSPELVARLSAIPKETRAATVEATGSISDTESVDVRALTDEQVRHILEWQEGLARAEAEAEAEAPLPGASSGMLIDFGGNSEVSAPEGEAWGGRLYAEAQDDAASELAGLEFRTF
ncbi:hypothetical protein TWF569_000699 [Orbilia oligospora]|uniref:Uncharacterized protein n=1 Tax=Orbilia oligospora TaxID=2813651 RepID=A0A7C8JLB5_ORBOL|nr:hypothetical protein TWF102_006272 [Orbilia oligospora]KAF3102150.1 hypothetical protein TWF706_005310 [Orbilia oligospora]KAF3112655.1 hypothetical protein TWF103_002890 [Orbilia oligospora]KAF3123925.1 hypothetical protein TWF594_002163 [Orbilia oligospora]KAF3125788.1 hypothetical protein TWF569_000699 [Orbilia oligospora]